MELAERKLVLARRRRGIILKLIREGHENQLPRLDDLELWTMLLKMAQTMGRDQVVTLLQDLRVLDYIDYKQTMNDLTGRIELSQIELTAAGLRLMVVGRSNDDVLFN
jgi:hypothetical protein